MKYEFNPEEYGFIPLGNTYIKYLPQDKRWYWTMRRYSYDERWEIRSGVKGDDREIIKYLGCITSDEFAEILLIHVMGTTTNEGTLKYGPLRLAGLKDNN